MRNSCYSNCKCDGAGTFKARLSAHIPIKQIFPSTENPIIFRNSPLLKRTDPCSISTIDTSTHFTRTIRAITDNFTSYLKLSICHSSVNVSMYYIPFNWKWKVPGIYLNCENKIREFFAFRIWFLGDFRWNLLRKSGCFGIVKFWWRFWRGGA